MRLAFLFSLLLFFVAPFALAHQLPEPNHLEISENHANTAHYLGNEAVLVQVGEQKVLFDPFFHKDFGFYQRVPLDLLDKIFAGEAP